MNNVSGAVEVGLEVFSGNNVDLQPSDLPSGLSWGCSDVAFLPGSCFTRPSLQTFSTNNNLEQIVYADTFLKPDGSVSQLTFQSDGKMFADGVQFGSTGAGNRFFTRNAFGKMYIAISDGIYGADVPLQYTPEGYLDRVSQDGPGAPPVLANLSVAASGIASGFRVNNEVTIVTTAPNNLNLGNLATIGSVNPFLQNLTSLVIDNSTLPGSAVATVPSPHGFVPGDSVAINNVQPITVGGSITAWSRASGLVTVITASAHNLLAGSTPLVQLNTDGFGPVIVLAVLSPTVFTYSNSGGDGTGTAGSVQLPWGLPTGSVITITAVPTSTTFQFDIIYNTGTWTTGNISFDWNGAFYVDSIISPTSFTYRQIGPDATITSGGTVTPTGQVSPGNHTVVQIFRTRTGYLTIPSPPVTVTASGGQYLALSFAAIGPPNVSERWFGITGANGGKYFVLPIPPRDPSGQFPIGTSTVIADNSTTTMVLDFTDEALFAGMAIDIPGNNLFAQEVLGPCVGFFNYASRLLPWGERNKIQQFLNMGFEGGFLATSPNSPLGWKITGAGTLTAGDYGQAWTSTTGKISQTAYQDLDGIAIAQPNTQYTYRAWVKGVSIATLSSASTGFLASAAVSSFGGFGQANFSQKTPAVIPPDLTLTISQDGATTHDELEIIYTNNPRRLTTRASYVNNPEAFDGVTGILGPEGDPHPVWGMEERKDVLCLLTNGPQGSLYETEDTASGEPATWDIRHIASKCGLVSVWGIALFEDWFSWTSDTGLRIFDGSTVDKMSQEIQPFWNSLNPLAKQITVLTNDPYTRRIYLLGATDKSVVTNKTYVLDYRELNTAGLLESSGTLRIGYSGKVITTDLTRKWSPWSMTMNYCGLLTQADGQAVMTFCGGTGGTLQDLGTSSVYTLREGEIYGIDDDYGPFWQNSFYPTYFFISDDDKKQNQLALNRMLYTFLTMNVSGVGSVFVRVAVDDPTNIVATTRAIPLQAMTTRDKEFGLNISGDRASFIVGCQPTGIQPAPPTAKAGFRLSSMTVAMKNHPYSPVGGWNK